jgi:hypothetical protein
VRQLVAFTRATTVQADRDGYRGQCSILSRTARSVSAAAALRVSRADTRLGGRMSPERPSAGPVGHVLHPFDPDTRSLLVRSVIVSSRGSPRRVDARLGPGRWLIAIGTRVAAHVFTRHGDRA